MYRSKDDENLIYTYSGQFFRVKKVGETDISPANRHIID
jgi:hypothetical protein